MIKYQQGVCSKCGEEKLIVNKSKKLCLICNKKASLARQIERKNKKIQEGKTLDPIKLTEFYKSYWIRNTLRVCYNCGRELSNYHSWHIHHIIGKKLWEKYSIDIVYNDDNCIYLCLECHSKAETNLDSIEKVKQLTINKLKEYESFKN